MALAFTLIFPLGVLWARFRSKGQVDRISRHKQLQVVGGILVLIAFAFVVIEIGDEGEHFDGLHSISGLIVVVWTALQFTIGYLRPEFRSSWRVAWQWFHLISGRVLYVAGPIVAAYGALMYVNEIGRELVWLLVLIIIFTIGAWVAYGALQAIEYLREQVKVTTRQVSPQ